VTAVAAYVPDLMDRSKVAGARADVAFVRQPAELVGLEAALYLVDLTRAGVLEVLPFLPGRVVGFANHAERELLDAARAAGCDEVLTRSAFFSRLGQIVGGPEA